MTEQEKAGINTIDSQTITITPHALDQFANRTGLTLVESAEQIRGRLEASTQIQSHPKIRLRKEAGTRFFQDLEGDSVYVVKKRKKGDLLVTVLRPLRQTRL